MNDGGEEDLWGGSGLMSALLAMPATVTPRPGLVLFLYHVDRLNARCVNQSSNYHRPMPVDWTIDDYRRRP